jgi:copper chaperone CopZ
MSQVILSVPNISCAHCERTVLETLEGKPGVNMVQVDVPTKKVYLDYDDSAITLDQVDALLDEEGYPVADSTPGAPPARRVSISLTSK